LSDRKKHNPAGESDAVCLKSMAFFDQRSGKICDTNQQIFATSISIC
jgi:hypothetical protein